MGVPLDEIERQLTEAAELNVVGTLNDNMYLIMVKGALVALPTPPAPAHIAVLRQVQPIDRGLGRQVNVYLG